MKTLSAMALAAALLAAALPATAAMNNSSATLTRPLDGATISAGVIDMSVYYTRINDKTFELVATYITDEAPDRPLQMFMALSDGDNVHFGLPGHPETLFGFARTGNTVTVSSQPVAIRDAGPATLPGAMPAQNPA